MRAIATLLLLCLTVLAVQPARAAEIETRSISLCRLTDGDAACEPVTAAPMPLTGPEYLLVAQVDIPPEAARSDQPIMVVLTGMIASEVRWNGHLIGSNGAPGPDRASEVPGRFFARFIIPPERVRPGLNTAVARISSHHLPLPVMNPVHEFHVAPYSAEPTWGLKAYLPALLMLGVLAVAGIYFTVAAVMDRGQRDAALLAAIAGLAMTQLAVETVRAFVNYPYPWHVWRVAAIAVLAAVTATLATAWSVRWFQPPKGRWLVGAVALAGAAAIALLPGYDSKASWSILAGMIALAGCAAWGMRMRVAGSWAALALTGAGIAVWTLQDSFFLDGPYYLMVALGLAVLVAGQVAALARARAERSAEADRARALEDTLARREAAMASIRDGTRTHRVPTAAIVALEAADDYCEVRLDDGRRLLSTASLAQTLAELPGDFVRVHKSWAVNALHVASIGPRPGGRKAVTLSDGAVAPVGRTYAAALERFNAGTLAANTDSPPSSAAGRAG